jgi:hypothetical protein
VIKENEMKPQKQATPKRERITDKNFKFPRHMKYMLAKIADPHLRGMWKRSFIEAAVKSEEHRRAKYVDIFVNARNLKETV